MEGKLFVGQKSLNTFECNSDVVNIHDTSHTSFFESSHV